MRSGRTFVLRQSVDAWSLPGRHGSFNVPALCMEPQVDLQHQQEDAQ